MLGAVVWRQPRACEPGYSRELLQVVFGEALYNNKRFSQRRTSETKSASKIVIYKGTLV